MSIKLGTIDLTIKSVAIAPAYTVSNSIENRTYDADSTTVNELADVLATIIGDLKIHSGISNIDDVNPSLNTSYSGTKIEDKFTTINSESTSKKYSLGETIGIGIAVSLNNTTGKVEKGGTNFVGITQSAGVLDDVVVVNRTADNNQTGLIEGNYYGYNTITGVIESGNLFKAISTTELNLVEKDTANSTDINGLTEKVTIDDNDEFMIYDTAGAVNKKVGLDNLKAVLGVPGMTLLNTTVISGSPSLINLSSAIFTSGYKKFVIKGFFRVGTSGAIPQVRVSKDDLSTFDFFRYVIHSGYTTTTSATVSGTNNLVPIVPYGINTAYSGVNFSLETNAINNFFNGDMSISSFSSVAGIMTSRTGIVGTTFANWNSLQFTLSTGVFTDGFISVYGLNT